MIALAAADATPVWVVGGYLLMLMGLGAICSRRFRGTSSDFFVASRSIGPFLLLMSVFGTTMTAFALVGSTGKAFQRGVGTYGLMASSSGLIHAASGSPGSYPMSRCREAAPPITQWEYFIRQSDTATIPAF